MPTKTGPEAASQIAVKKLDSLLKASRSCNCDIQSLRDTLGEKIAKAVENEHLHKRAFAAVVKEDKMEPEELRDFYDAQEYYRDVLGLNERAKSAPAFDLEADKEADKPEKGNVRPIRAPSSVAAE